MKSLLTQTGTPTRRPLSIAVLAMATFASCSDAPKKNESGSASAHHSQTETSQEPAAALKDSADVAVRQVLSGLQQRKVRAVWDFLPPSYRAEGQQLVRDVAAKLDERTWKRTLTVWRKAQSVLRAKTADWKSVAVSDKTSDITETRRQLADGLLSLLDCLEKSELAELGRLREIDLGHFAEATGGDLLRVLVQIPLGGQATSAPFAVLSRVEVKLVSESKDQAVVRMQWPGQDATEHSYVRVEGHWLPTSLVEGWPSGLAEVRMQVFAWADSLRDHPEAWESRLSNIESWLDELASSKSDEQSQLVFQRGLAQVVAIGFGAAPATSLSPESADKPQSANTSKKSKIPDTEELLPDDPQK